MNDIYESWVEGVMFQFVTHFEESDNDWMSLDDLLALFRTFTGKQWLSSQMFIARYKPQSHFKKHIKRFRNKGGSRKERVGYRIKQIKPLSQNHIDNGIIITNTLVEDPLLAVLRATQRAVVGQ